MLASLLLACCNVSSYPNVWARVVTVHLVTGLCLSWMDKVWWILSMSRKGQDTNKWLESCSVVAAM